MIEIPIVVAFIAGLVSFLAPCVLPIIPGFLAYLAGSSLTSGQVNRRETFLNALFFVLGFSFIFALLGVLLNTVLESIAYDVQIWLSRVGGAIIIFFGLYVTGLIHIAFLDRDHKFRVTRKFSSRYVTSFVFGLAFAAGWTPCVGATLGAILGLAATSPGSAFTLLLTYALGLGIPFLIVGMFASEAASFLNRFASLVKYINIVFGLLLVIIGILVFTENLARIASFSLLNNLLLAS